MCVPIVRNAHLLMAIKNLNKNKQTLLHQMKLTINIKDSLADINSLRIISSIWDLLIRVNTNKCKCQFQYSPVTSHSNRPPTIRVSGSCQTTWTCNNTSNKCSLISLLLWVNHKWPFRCGNRVPCSRSQLTRVLIAVFILRRKTRTVTFKVFDLCSCSSLKLAWITKTCCRRWAR